MWGTNWGSGPARVSSLDDSNLEGNQNTFKAWKAEQAELVTRRGEAPEDPAAEERHNRNMLRHCMNAYVCHLEMDSYASCLRKHGLLGDEDTAEVPTRAAACQTKCGVPLERYTSCLGRQEHQETVINAAITNSQCRHINGTLVQCLSIQSDPQEAEKACESTYRRLVRCGLNHLWEEYWRALNDVGDPEEFRAFEISRDTKRREYFNAKIIEMQSKPDWELQAPGLPSDLRKAESYFKD